MADGKSRASWFSRFARAMSRAAGQPAAFAVAAGSVVTWLLTGPWAGFSDTWQLVINTGTTIVTFLMVFLIQNAQNRDAEATQLKLDELLRATRGAQNEMMDLEEHEEGELKKMLEHYEQMAHRARERLGQGARKPQAGRRR